MTRQVDASAKKVDTVDIHSFNNKFSTACGSAQRVDGSLYVVSFDVATKDNEYMAVIDFATGKKLLSVWVAVAESRVSTTRSSNIRQLLRRIFDNASIEI